MALRGILSNFAVAGSCTITIPFFSFKAQIPALPSEPMPERMTPIPCSCRSSASERKKKSIGRRSPLASIGSNSWSTPFNIDILLFGGITYTQFDLTVMRSFTWKTFIFEIRWSNSGNKPFCVGSRCWITTYAIPLFSGTLPRNCSNASSPPADAPIPTIGNLPVNTSEISTFEDVVDFRFMGFMSIVFYCL